MSEREDFEADYISGVIYKFEVNSEVKFEDYRTQCAWAGWQARAARTAPAEPVAWVSQCRTSGLIEQCEPNEKASNHAWTDAFPVYTAPDALQAEVERLKQFEAAYMEWSDKTEWARSIVETKDLGKHLADIVREKFERLRKDRKSCWEEFKALVKSSKEREGELKAENERLREEVERLKEERHDLKERFYVAIKILRQCRYVPQAGLRLVVIDFLARINKEDAAKARKARTAKPEVKS